MRVSRLRPIVGLALALGGIAAACLLFGMGNGSDCAAATGATACIVRSLGSIREWVGFATVAGAGVGGLVGMSVVVQAHRHHRLAALLDGIARPDRLAGQSVRVASGLAGPHVAGLLRPEIYCPSDLAVRLSEVELRAVILHERHHQRAHAPARLVLLAAIAPVLGWVEPGRRWLERRRAAIEIEADDYALRVGARRPDLARALVKLGSAGLVVGVPSYASASELRLRHLTGDARLDGSRLGSMAPMLVSIAAFVVCLIVGGSA
jgi:hypothetical protein